MGATAASARPPRDFGGGKNRLQPASFPGIMPACRSGALSRAAKAGLAWPAGGLGASPGSQVLRGAVPSHPREGPEGLGSPQAAQIHTPEPTTASGHGGSFQASEPPHRRGRRESAGTALRALSRPVGPLGPCFPDGPARHSVVRQPRQDGDAAGPPRAGGQRLRTGHALRSPSRES